MKISKRVEKIELSPARDLYNRAKQYQDIIDLTLGDPDIKPKDEIIAAAHAAMIDGKTRYSANAGLSELRETIGKCISLEYGLDVDPTKEIAVTVGGMEALYLTINALVDEGDEVVVIAPYYPNYLQMIRMSGGIPKIVYTDEENGFCPTKEQIAQNITERTVAVIVNSPSNPTGIVYPRELIQDIASLAIENDLTVISDEVYKTLVFGGKHHESILNIDGMRDRTVLIDSISKRFAMTGYRLGYLFAPKALVDVITKLQENVCACAPLPSQYAAVEAYTNHIQDRNVAEVYEERTRILADELNKIDGIRCISPEGTFYIFANIKETGMDCMEFALKLLEAEQVAVVPGIAYGEEYTDYVRIACTRDKETLVRAAKKISRLINGGEKG